MSFDILLVQSLGVIGISAILIYSLYKKKGEEQARRRGGPVRREPRLAALLRRAHRAPYVAAEGLPVLIHRVRN